MEVRQGYKETEIGVLPNDWTITRLGNIADIKDGTHQTPKYVPFGIPFYSVEQVTKNDFKNTKYISEEEHKALSHSFKIEKGDILMTRIGSIGECKLIDWDVNASFYVSLALLKVHGADPKYIEQYSKSTQFIQETELHSLPSAIPKKINLGPISDIRIATPPHHEQSAIATALNDMDALLESLNILIAKKRAIKQATMQQLLSGKTRLAGHTHPWKSVKLGDVTHIKTGSRNNEDKCSGGAYPFFVRSECVERIDTYSHDCEAILVPGEGRIGDIYHYVNGKFDVHQRVYAITQFSADAHAKYVYLYMKNRFGSWALKNTVKATVDSLRLPTFQDFEIQLPSSIDEQKAIAAIINDEESEVKAMEAKLMKYQYLKQAMMQELLTGRTRLI